MEKDKDFFAQPKQEDIIKGNVINGISNAHEVLKTDTDLKIEEEVQKGEVEVISMDDVKESHGNVFWKGEDVAAINAKCESVIEKGEKDFLGEGEWADLEKAMDSIKELERKAIAVPFRGGHIYREIFVRPIEKKED